MGVCVIIYKRLGLVEGLPGTPLEGEGSGTKPPPLEKFPSHPTVLCLGAGGKEGDPTQQGDQ